MNYDDKLNQPNRPSFKRRLSTTSDGFSDVQDAVLRVLYEDELDISGIYDGVVLTNVDDEVNPFLGAIESAVRSFKVAFDIGQTVRKYKVRVSGIHDMIPAPQHAEDCIAISMHHTFVETVGLNNTRDLACGELVKVSFIDGSGRFNPRIVQRVPSKNPVCIFTETNSPRGSLGNPNFDANMVSPNGDAIGSGKKCAGNQLPMIYNQEDEASDDSVLRWLSIIRGVRNNLQSKIGVDLSLFKDAAVLALIEIESNGETGLGRDTSIRKGNRSQFYGILQQRDDNIHFAYDWSLGRKVRAPFAASNLINFEGHPDQHLGTRIHQKGGTEAEKKVLRDLQSVSPTTFQNFEQAGATAIEAAFLNWYRARKVHEGNLVLLASYHNGGGIIARKIKERAVSEGIAPLDAAIKLESEGETPGIVPNLKYMKDFSIAYDKWNNRLGEYNPQAAIFREEPCVEESEFIDPSQAALDPNDTLQSFLDKNGIKYFKATELLSRATRGGPKEVEPPREKWPDIIPTLKLAEQIREIIGQPIGVTSAYRSPEYNAMLDNAKPSSEHVQFKAIDLKYSDYERLKEVATSVVNNAAGSFATGLGFYDDEGDLFIHIDTGSSKKHVRRWGGAPEPNLSQSTAIENVGDGTSEEGDVAASAEEGTIEIYQKVADWYNRKLPASSQLTLEDAEIIAPFVTVDGEIDFFGEGRKDDPILSSGTTFTFDDGTPLTKQRLIERILERNQ